jgi:hypothetical protein
VGDIRKPSLYRKNWSGRYTRNYRIMHQESSQFIEIDR